MPRRPRTSNLPFWLIHSPVMDRATATRDLQNLLPSLVGPLPQELIDLTSSILAQSRSKATRLKQDEEIARSYVCANIACERLKQRLDLPDIIPKPPCNGRTYKKLFEYLNATLGPSRDRGDAAQHHGHDGASRTPKSTPRKQQLFSAGTKGQPTRLPPRKTKLPQSESEAWMRGADTRDEDLPTWIMVSIRALCKAIGTSAAVPHVFSGVSSVIRHVASETAESSPSGRRSRKSPKGLKGLEEKNITALIAVIAFYTIGQFEEAPSAEEYALRRNTAFKVMQKNAPFKDMKAEQFIEDVELYMREAQKGWLELEWFGNLVGGLDEDIEDSDDVDLGDAGDHHGTNSRRKRKREQEQDENAMEQRAGFGEMCMYAVDWLSDDRLKDYEKWKSRILERLQQERAIPSR